MEKVPKEVDEVSAVARALSGFGHDEWELLTDEVRESHRSVAVRAINALDETRMTNGEVGGRDVDINLIMDDGSIRSIFSRSTAVAHLLLEDVLKVVGTGSAGEATVMVNCSDVFAWATADLEPLPTSEVENLYRMWQKDPWNGPTVWCIARRRQMPQRPVEKAIREEGVWDLDSMQLQENWMDAHVTGLVRAHAEKLKSGGW